MIWKREVTLDALNAMGEGNMVGLLDIRFEHIGDDTLEATMPVDHRTKQPFGLLHGGASVVLAESIGSVANICVRRGAKGGGAGGECQPCTVGASGARTRRL